MYSAHYHASSPAYAVPQDAYYRTPPVSPSPGVYYSPRYKLHTATPSPRASPKYHMRQSSHQDPPVCSFGAAPRYYCTSSPRYDARDSTHPRVFYQTPEHNHAQTADVPPPRDSTASPPRRAASGPKRPSSMKKKKKNAPPPRPVATAEDARRAGIPAGFSYKNWDPAEEPILLLGSVFDANSLGKWVYDWTVFHHGALTPLSEMAGELWLLLIQLAGKIRRAEECAHKIRNKESKETVEEFLNSGERLWLRVNKLLKICEDYMWEAARRDAGGKKPLKMGNSSGVVFVRTIFGRERELERTEKLMAAIRLWNMRFDANCDDILQYPSA